MIAGLAFRSDEYPLVDVKLIGFDAAVPTETAEQALRRFLRERLQRVSGYPRPTNGILLAMTVMNSTLASSGRPAM